MSLPQWSDSCHVAQPYLVRHWLATWYWARVLGLWAGALFLLNVSIAEAQTAAIPAAGFAAAPGNRQSNGNGSGQPNVPGLGAVGGSAQADFDALMELVQSTVASDSWLQNGTGEGEMQPFPGGVLVDAEGVLRLTVNNQTVVVKSTAGQAPAELLRLRRKTSSHASVSENAHTQSKLRFVSLPKLELAIARRQQLHQPLTIDMLVLAGLRQIEYVLISPPTDDSQLGDLVLAGPAGAWQVQPTGRIVATSTGRPLVRLDDLLVMLRRYQTAKRRSFGCSITPRRAALAATQDYLRATNTQPLKANGRNRWLTGLRDTLGKQDVEFFGIDPQTHVASILLAADYHMKLIGMGLVDGVDGVDSYLSTVTLSPDGAPPSMNVLRWWFTMHYHPVATNRVRDTFQIRGPGVQVLSENELLSARGRRVHTGESNELNRQFATNFTAAFEQLSHKFPIYAELHNLFDLALVVALIEAEGLAERAGWSQGPFMDAHRLRLPAVATPKHVETVINHRLLKDRHIIAGVSGGVWIDAASTLRVRAVKPATLPPIWQSRTTVPDANEIANWWWD
jgi:Protein of unknown function (DUF1598)